jgi:hypothetical protein
MMKLRKPGEKNADRQHSFIVETIARRHDGDPIMNIYQIEEGQIGLTFAVVLTEKDLDKILKHNPITTRIGPLQIHVSFCEPPKPVSFGGGIYFVSLCFKEIRLLKGGSTAVITNMIEDVPFILAVFLEKDGQNVNHKLKQVLHLLLNRRIQEQWL